MQTNSPSVSVPLGSPGMCCTSPRAARVVVYSHFYLLCSSSLVPVSLPEVPSCVEAPNRVRPEQSSFFLNRWRFY